MLFECQNIMLGYDGHTVVEDLSFSVDEGDYVCIVGENGSGKSTLIRTLLGLQKPLSGKIVSSDDFTASRIGYMPQKTTLQKDFPASVMETVLSGTLGRKGFFGRYTANDKKDAVTVLQKLGIASLSDRSIRELSGGQQQRVFLARALMAAKNVILADEPCTGLDANATAELYALIHTLNKKDGLTVIMVTHDKFAASIYADKVLDLGKRMFYTSKEAYLAANDTDAQEDR